MGAIENVIRFLLSPASIKWPGGSITGPFILVEPALLAFLIFFVASLIWVWKDAQKRGKNSFVVLLFILLTGWPLSFVWWFFLRPQPSGGLARA